MNKLCLFLAISFASFALAYDLPLQKISLAKFKSPTVAQREVFFVFRNSSPIRIQSFLANLKVNGSELKGKVFARTESGWRSRLAVMPGEEGAIVVPMQPKRPWTHCQKLVFRADFSSIDPISGHISRFTIAGSQRLHDEVYASPCSHLK